MKVQFSDHLRLCLLIILLLALLPLTGYSQETGSCAENLKNAQSLFDKGQVDMVPSMISGCLKTGFNREESLSAYKLIIQSYLFEEKYEQADSVMMGFLKKNPEYQISPTDHSSFVHLFNNFKVKSQVQISFHIGTNLPFLTSVNYITESGEPGKNSYNTNALNLFTSVEAKFQINKKLELNMEAGYSKLSFTNIEDFTQSQRITYSENQSRIEIPISVTYNIAYIGKVTPYGRIGFGPALIIGSFAQISVDPTDNNNPIHHTGTDVNRSDSRILTDLFTQVGAGIKYKTRGGFLFAEVRSNFGVFNQTLRGGALAQDPKYFYYFDDDDFHINALNFNIGYTQIFYKPSKTK